MDRGSKRRGRPVPGALDDSNIKPIIFNLEEALAVETLYRPNLLVIQNDIKPGEVTLEARDAIVHLLRFMKVWFDVPEKAYFLSVTYLDLFIERTKVQEKYLKCVAFACFFIAAESENLSLSLFEIMSISQSNFRMDDVKRMAGIIKTKLKLQITGNKVTTCADILKLYLQYFNSTNSSFIEKLNEDHLLNKLEVLMTDSNCAFFRPSALAFTLLRLEIDQQFLNTINNRAAAQLEDILTFVTALKELQKKSKLRAPELVSCSHQVSKVLKKYHNGKPCSNNSYVKWKCFPESYRIGPFCSSLGSITERPRELARERQTQIFRT